jgi:hypothetical protein
MTKLILILFIVSCSPQQPKDPQIPEPIPPVKGVYYQTTLTSQWAIDLTRISNCVLNHEGFIKEVSAIEKFDFTFDKGIEVIAKYRQDKVTNIKLIKPKAFWSSMVATTFAGNTDDFFLSTKKNPRPMPSMINTAIHERGHLVGYGHGDNYAKGKEDSVNYKLGSISEKYVADCQ